MVILSFVCVIAIGKKLTAAGNKKSTEELGLWAKGVKNHLYFSVLSSEGKPD